MAGPSLAFGPFLLDPAGVVWRDGRPLPLGRRGVRLLEILLRRRGQVVPKAELIDAAWPDEMVEENNLSVQIAQLRKRLGGDWIRTVERVGYQLLDEPSPRPSRLAPSLAIAAFKDLGGAADVAAALADELTTVLTPFGSLRVVAPAVGVGAADYVLEGGVRRDHGKLQVTVRLAERRSGHYRWADRFEFPRMHRPPIALITSMVESQVELAELAAVREERPESDEAPDIFRRALWHMRRCLPDSNALSRALLERALAQDPDNTLYLGIMCELIGNRISMGWPALTDTDTELMFACASHGLRQPIADAEALSHFGFGLFRSGDPDRGYGLMQRGADLNSNSVTALKLAGQAEMSWGGSLVDSEAYYRRALLLDPHHPGQGPVMAGLARIRMARGDFEDALRWAGRAHLANANFGPIHWTLIAANAMLGRAEEAARCLDRFRAAHPGVTIERFRAGQPKRAPLSATIEGLDRAGLAWGRS